MTKRSRKLGAIKSSSRRARRFKYWETLNLKSREKRNKSELKKLGKATLVKERQSYIAKLNFVLGGRKLNLCAAQLTINFSMGQIQKL